MDKRTIIAFVLIGLILFFYGDFLRWLNPPPPFSPTDSSVVATDSRAPAPARPQHEGPGAIAPVSAESLVLTPSFFGDTLAALPKRLVTVETERYRAVLTTAGAQLVSLRLKPYKRYLRDEVELVPDAPGARPGFRFWTTDGPLATTALTYAVEDEPGSDDVWLRLSGGRRDSIRLIASLGGGRALRVTYGFVGDQFQMFCSVEGVGTGGLFVRDYAEVVWNGGLAYTEPDTAQDHSFSMAYTFFAGDALEEQKIEKKSIVTGLSSGHTRWGAVRTKYFIVALLPETVVGVGSWMESAQDTSYAGSFPPNRLGVGIRLPLAGGSPATPLRIYAGPLDEDLLGDVDPSLKQTMNWGWPVIAWFSKAILWGLKALFSVIPNYGVCIIIFSVLIKAIIWPLTHKSYASMAAMQRLQPRLAALREKYKSDAQRLNKEMMKLYKEQKVNPMGGCLPMLLQLPLLYALFIVFRSTIEFRQAPFVFWIHDLSLPDYVFTLPFALPIYGSQFAVLPVFMAVTTYFQSKATMTDPNQKMLLYMMPVMMLLFFNGFPSGLTLYYTLFNVWTMLQMKIMPPPKMAPAAG